MSFWWSYILFDSVVLSSCAMFCFFPCLFQPVFFSHSLSDCLFCFLVSALYSPRVPSASSVCTLASFTSFLTASCAFATCLLLLALWIFRTFWIIALSVKACLLYCYLPDFVFLQAHFQMSFSDFIKALMCIKGGSTKQNMTYEERIQNKTGNN